MKKQGVLFDFDYTLGDCTEAIVESIRAAFRELGYPPPETEAIRATVGLMLDDAFTQLTGLPAPETFTPRFRHYALPRMARDARLLPGAAELLARLNGQGLRLGLVTSKSRQMAREIAKKFRFPMEVIVSCQDVEHPKPHPEALLLAAEQMKLPVEALVYVGDAAVDARAAAAAGMDFIAVTTGTTGREIFSGLPHFAIIPDLFHFPTCEE